MFNFLKKGGVQEAPRSVNPKEADKILKEADLSEEAFSNLLGEVEEIDGDEFRPYQGKAQRIYAGNIKDIIDDFGKGNTGDSQMEDDEIAINDAQQAVKNNKRVVVAKDENGVENTYIIDSFNEN